MLVAAVESVGESALVERAAARLGVTVDEHDSNTFAGLLQWGPRLVFRHPLACSAIYRAASPQERREAHRALAEVTDPVVDADRRAWHLGHATQGPDEDVAIELERSAGRAQARGGLAAAAAFLERASQLTASPGRRAQRALAAAQAKLQIGALDSAMVLLGIAEEGPLNELQHARIDVLRAERAFASSRGNEAPPLLLGAARRLEPLNGGLARDTYLNALSAAMFAGRLASGIGVVEVSQAARRMARPRDPGLGDLLLDALSTLFTDGYAAAVGKSKRALRACCGDEVGVEEGLRWFWLAAAIAADLWDDESWHFIAARYVQMARDAGALSELLLALNSRIVIEAFTGQLRTAAALVDETCSVSEVIGIDMLHGALWLSAYHGREQEAAELSRATLTEASAQGRGVGLTVTQATNAMLANSLGQYERALVEAQHAGESPWELAAPNWGLTELVEAAARLGNGELATAAFACLSEMTSASGTEWALGIEARSRAQLSDDDIAERFYLEAIDRLSRTRVRTEYARARLLYGEWLRRRRRRLDARDQLGGAYEMFTTMARGVRRTRPSRTPSHR